MTSPVPEPGAWHGFPTEAWALTSVERASRSAGQMERHHPAGANRDLPICPGSSAHAEMSVFEFAHTYALTSMFTLVLEGRPHAVKLSDPAGSAEYAERLRVVSSVTAHVVGDAHISHSAHRPAITSMAGGFRLFSA